jgi:hypothetical protein
VSDETQNDPTVPSGKPKRTRAKKQQGLDASAVALIAAEVAKALAAVQQHAQPVPGEADHLRDIARKDPVTWTAEDKAALLKEHQRLNTALEALPFIGDTVMGKLRPGTAIGEGITREYVPHDQAWFLDVEERRKDRNLHNGRTAELTWPEYGLHEVIYQGMHPFEEVCINAVCFGLLPGQPCMLPTPHYGLYRSRLAGLRAHEEYFAPPVPKTTAGYLHAKVGSNGKMVAVLLGKGPLPAATEREAQDAKYPG